MNYKCVKAKCSAIKLNVAFYQYHAERHYSECHYAECCGTMGTTVAQWEGV
jgi:hypothetical protein